MTLAIKFNLLLIAIFAVGIGTASVVAGSYLRSGAREQVMQQARFMMDTSASTRKYTSEHIRPILDKYQRNSAAFYPESVPAFSASRMFGYLHDIYPEYSYKEATLNPTNPADRPLEWEADVVNLFRNSPSKHEFSGERDAAEGRLLYLARPIQATESCMECHSTPDVAPKAMVEVYGRDNGFGWKLNEIVGAQIVSVPESMSQTLAGGKLLRFVVLLTGVALAMLAMIDVVFFAMVLRPMARISATACEMSKGNLFVEELPEGGRDEMSALAGALNRVQRSLVKAIKGLEQGPPARRS